MQTTFIVEDTETEFNLQCNYGDNQFFTPPYIMKRKTIDICPRKRKKDGIINEPKKVLF